MHGTPKYPLDYTAAPDDVKYLGTEVYFENISQYFASTDAYYGVGAWCKARWVINLTGSTLAAGIRVEQSTESTYGPGAGVKTVAGADEVFAGFVCPFVDAAIADDAGFWLITEGFTKVGYDGSATFAVGDALSGAASGWVAEAGGTYEDPWIIGAAGVAKTSGSAGDLILAFVKLPF